MGTEKFINPTREIKSNCEVFSTPFDKFQKPFSPEYFPKCIRGISDNMHEVDGTPQEMSCFCALGIIAGLAGDKYKLQNADSTGKTQYPNQYLIGIGDSSAGKSITINPLLDPARRIIQRAYDVYKENKCKGTNPNFIIADATSEALTDRQQEIEQALFSVTSEARKVFSIIGGEYKQNKGDGVSYYNTAWSAEPYSSIRITRREVSLKKAFLSSLWLTQTDAFNDFLSNSVIALSGLAPRFICFKVDVKPRYKDGTIRSYDERIFYEWRTISEELLNKRLEQNVKIIRATDEARRVFDSYYNGIVDDMIELGHPYDGLIAKSAEKAMRMALDFAICNKSDVVDEETARNACSVIDYSNGIITDYFRANLFVRNESVKAKIEELFYKQDTTRLSFAVFKQFKRIEEMEIQRCIQQFPQYFEIEEAKPYGKYLILKSS